MYFQRTETGIYQKTTAFRTIHKLDVIIIVLIRNLLTYIFKN